MRFIRKSLSRICRKYKNVNCCSHFGKFFTDKTIVVKPLPKNMPEEVKKKVLMKSDTIPSTVKNYIYANFNPKNKAFLIPEKKILL